MKRNIPFSIKNHFISLVARIGLPVAAIVILPSNLMADDNSNVHVLEGYKAEYKIVLETAPQLSRMIRYSYYTSNGTAKSGDDYVYTTGKIVYSPGETTKEAKVQTYEDSLDEGYPETFTFVVHNLETKSIWQSDDTWTKATYLTQFPQTIEYLTYIYDPIPGVSPHRDHVPE